MRILIRPLLFEKHGEIQLPHQTQHSPTICRWREHSSFAALARHFNISGGRKVVRDWFRRWDGTPLSLERKEGSGRRALLTPSQVNKLITKPIRRCNQNHTAVEYPELWKSVQQELGPDISLRTIQRYGKKQEGIRNKTTIPRTSAERSYVSHD